MNIKHQIHNLFSNSDDIHTDIYEYEIIPEKLKIQLLHLIFPDNKCILDLDDLKDIYEIILSEHGILKLCKSNYECLYNNIDYYKTFKEYFKEAMDINIFLDIIKLILNKNEYYCETNEYYCEAYRIIELINHRFIQNSFGYMYENGYIIKISNIQTHINIIKPTIVFLTNPKLSGANDEYLKAHELFKNGDYESCLIECLKSFESTCKIILDYNSIKYDKSDTVKKLIGHLFKNNLLDDYLKDTYNKLDQLFEIIGTPRNKNSGHGKGNSIRNVDFNFAQFYMNLVSTHILFLSKLIK